MAREEIYLAICKVVVVPAPHSVEGEEGIYNPSLLEGVSIADTYACHNTETTTKALFKGYQLSILEEIRASQIESLHSSIGTNIETSCLALNVETILCLQNAEQRVNIVAIAPLYRFVGREHWVYRY